MKDLTRSRELARLDFCLVKRAFIKISQLGNFILKFLGQWEPYCMHYSVAHNHGQGENFFFLLMYAQFNLPKNRENLLFLKRLPISIPWILVLPITEKKSFTNGFFHTLLQCISIFHLINSFSPQPQLPVCNPISKQREASSCFETRI